MDKFLNRTARLASKARRAYLAEDNLWKNFNFEAELESITKNFSKLNITADNILILKICKHTVSFLVEK